MGTTIHMGIKIISISSYSLFCAYIHSRAAAATRATDESARAHSLIHAFIQTRMLAAPRVRHRTQVFRRRRIFILSRVCVRFTFCMQLCVCIMHNVQCVETNTHTHTHTHTDAFGLDVIRVVFSTFWHHHWAPGHHQTPVIVSVCVCCGQA